MKKILLISLVVLFALSGFAQRIKDTVAKGLYSKWKVCFNNTPSLGFNFGDKIPWGYNPSMNDVYWGGWNYENDKENPKIGYQVALEAVSKSFFKNNFAFRLGLDFEDFYCHGTATGIEQSLQSTYPTLTYSYTYYPGHYNYYFQSYFLNAFIIPQYNFYQKNKVDCYYFLGPSLARLVNEEDNKGYQYYQNNLNYDQYSWDSKVYVVFGVIGFGTTTKISKDCSLDLQMRFNCQLYKTPDGRRNASAGLRVGILF